MFIITSKPFIRIGLKFLSYMTQFLFSTLGLKLRNKNKKNDGFNDKIHNVHPKKCMK